MPDLEQTVIDLESTARAHDATLCKLLAYHENHTTNLINVDRRIDILHALHSTLRETDIPIITQRLESLQNQITNLTAHVDQRCAQITTGTHHRLNHLEHHVNQRTDKLTAHLAAVADALDQLSATFDRHLETQ